MRRVANLQPILNDKSALDLNSGNSLPQSEL